MCKPHRDTCERERNAEAKDATGDSGVRLLQLTGGGGESDACPLYTRVAFDSCGTRGREQVFMASCYWVISSCVWGRVRMSIGELHWMRQGTDITYDRRSMARADYRLRIGIAGAGKISACAIC